LTLHYAVRIAGTPYHRALVVRTFVEGGCQRPANKIRRVANATGIRDSQPYVANDDAPVSAAVVAVGRYGDENASRNETVWSTA